MRYEVMIVFPLRTFSMADLVKAGSPLPPAWIRRCVIRASHSPARPDVSDDGCGCWVAVGAASWIGCCRPWRRCRPPPRTRT